MGWLWAGLVVLLLGLLLSLRFSFLLLYDRQLVLKVGVGPFRKTLYPTLRQRLDDPSLSLRRKRRILKKLDADRAHREKKQAKKAKNAEKKEAKKKKKKPAEPKKPAEKKPETKRSIASVLRLVSRLVGLLLKKFGRHLHLHVKRLEVEPATGDAASTAYLFGALSQSVAYLLALTQAACRLKVDNKNVWVRANFLAEQTTLRLAIKASVSPGGLLLTLLGTAWAFFRLTVFDKKKTADPADSSPKNPPGERSASPAKEKTSTPKTAEAAVPPPAADTGKEA